MMKQMINQNSYRSKQALKGPQLPMGVKFPCLLNLKEDLTFVIGIGLKDKNQGNTNKLLDMIYLFNHTDEKWIKLSSNLSCLVERKSKVSCAFLSNENSVIASYGNCLAIINLTSLTSISMEMKFQTGLVFNIDGSKNDVVYIGTDAGFEGSSIYMVCIRDGQGSH